MKPPLEVIWSPPWPVASLTAWRFSRLLGAVLVPLSVLLTLATVYGQFHYAVDAVAGAAVAAIVLALAPRLTGPRDAER